MPYRQLTITSSQKLPEGLAERLQEIGAISVTLEGDGREIVVERYLGDTPLWQEGRLTALFEEDVDEERVLRALRDEPGNLSQEWSILEDRDWEREWMGQFQPLRFGERLWVCPSWIEPPDPDAINLRLDPGMAFGTGTHETTALCLEWLAAHPPADAEVVDFGCGSGILAVAALLLGCRRAWATDIDVRALEATRTNAARNGIERSRLEILRPEALPGVQADLVIANILAQPLIDLAPRIAALLAPGATLLLSGLLERQQDAVRAAYADHVRFVECTMKQEWVLLVGTRL